MKTTRPEVGFERLLAALERDLLDATDEEIRAVAHELGIRPEMKGSSALLGVTAAARFNPAYAEFLTRRTEAADHPSASRSRRRSKRDIPPSS